MPAAPSNLLITSNELHRDRLAYRRTHRFVAVRHSLGAVFKLALTSDLPFSPFPLTLALLITGKQIRGRFVLCLEEVTNRETVLEVSKKLQCSYSYLSAVKKAPNPEIPATLIANFCIKYGYSVTYIMTGKGDRRTETRTLTKEEKWERERENLHELIARLIKAGVDKNPVAKLAREVLKQKS